MNQAQLLSTILSKVQRRSLLTTFAALAAIVICLVPVTRKQKEALVDDAASRGATSCAKMVAALVADPKVWNDTQGIESLLDRIALQAGMEITGPSDYVFRLRNSVIITGISTIFSVVLGLFAAYAFSRFKVPGKNDLLFFILSTRMLPAVVVTIPLFLMYRQLGLYDRHLGMILLYIAFNLSFSVWLLKGFIDEIPKEYEEAALVDGYTRLQAFFRVVLPQAVTGIAATTVFCLIFAWNEYAFALMLTSQRARTAPPSIATMLGSGGLEWSAIAAGSLGFLVPVVIVTFALRKYLLRGITFGAIRG